MASKHKKVVQGMADTKLQTGRPQKRIDPGQFQKLCGMQCSKGEIAAFFDCHENTLSAWCHRTYGTSFADAQTRFSSIGKIGLRRTQLRLAQTNANMAIHLGKAYLGQRDEVNITTTYEDLTPLAALLGVQVPTPDAVTNEPGEGAGALPVIDAKG